MKKILQKESPLLRDIAKSVPVEEILRPRIKKILKEMRMALESQDDGVAIAAPQIGYPLRMFVISRKIFEINKTDKNNLKSTEKDFIFINPVIKKCPRKKVL